MSINYNYLDGKNSNNKSTTDMANSHQFISSHSDLLSQNKIDFNSLSNLSSSSSASYNLFNKNFTTYMKYSETGNTIDINMALSGNETTSGNMDSSTQQMPTTQLKNANSHELDQFRAEKLFNNTKESRLNDLLAAASLSIKLNNESKILKSLDTMDIDKDSSENSPTTAMPSFFLKRQANGIQSNLCQYSDLPRQQQQQQVGSSSTNVKKEINTIAIDQVLDKLTNSIKNDKKLSSNIRFPNETAPLESSVANKSSVCSSSSASSSSSSCSSSRTESNEKPISSNSISLNRSHQPLMHAQSSSQLPKSFELFLGQQAKPNHHHQQQHQTEMKQEFAANIATTTTNNNNNNNGATTSSTHQAQDKAQFNIENELIKYTKNLKLTPQVYTDFYKLGAHIRNGGFSEIYEGIQTKSNDKVIIKLIPKRKTKNWLMVHNKKYPAEILLHKMSNNIAGVVKMLEFYEQENEWIIIMPKLLNCMDLFDYLESKQRGRLSETEACHFFTQLVRINIDLMSQGVVHRDIKSENILVDLDTMKLVLIDFGASAICRNTNKLNNGSQHYYTDFHGTRQYKPPEYIAHKKYTALASTIWTLGILLYDMCNGQLPFETEQEILEYNLQIKANVSEEYKQLLYDCLKLDPALRPTLDQVLSYSWCVINTAKQLSSNNMPTTTSNQSNSSIPSLSSAITSNFISASTGPLISGDQMVSANKNSATSII